MAGLEVQGREITGVYFFTINSTRDNFINETVSKFFENTTRLENWGNAVI